MKTIQDITDDHFNWVEKLGWHNKTMLECICLIHEEVAELGREFRSSDLNYENVANEMSDIILRVLDLSKILNINIDQALQRRIAFNKARKTNRVK